jgi:hypothetical protein
MLRRSLTAPALAALVTLAGCQDYNFNPVGKCVIQPGSARVQVANISAADILFVVDDSGSMAAQQASLARNFDAFITALTGVQESRKARGLEPFEFHIAVSTSSVFEAWQASGAPSCTANQCSIQSPTLGWTAPYTYACTGNGPCPDVVDKYYFTGGCALPGVGAAGNPYPAGDFVRVGANPRVLHFTKDLFDGTAGAAARLQSLADQFRSNIQVGICGSGMEQHLEAGRLAVQKAIAGTQPGVARDEWPHPNAKMVVVFVGDEDDCSNPKSTDPNRTLFFLSGNTPGNDVCTQDAVKPAGQQKLIPVSQYADFFTGLNRSFSAAFIYSAVNCRAEGGNTVCDPGLCACECPRTCSSCGPSAAGECRIPAECSGKSTGTRLHDLSAALRGRGVATLDGSVCAANFADTLRGIAQLVTPPTGLNLPSQPAAAQVSVLRIEGANGNTVRTCLGPATENTDAARAAADWWFVSCESGAFSTVPTTCIAVNPGVAGRPSCEPNPGESYIAQYLGLVPQEGCTSNAFCQELFKSSDVRCETPAGQARGSCVCGTAP